METNGTQTNARERNCVECGHPIPVERLRALPHAWTCVRCSPEVKKPAADLVDGADRSDMVASAESRTFDPQSHR